MALASVALFLLSALGALRLEFSLDPKALLDRTDPLRASLAEYQQEFPQPKDLVVVVEGGTPETRQQVVRALARLLEREPAFRDPFWGLELPSLRERALFYLEPARLQELEADLSALGPFLALFSRARDLGEFLALSRQDLLVQGLDNPQLLPLLDGLFQDVQGAVRSRGKAHYAPPWSDRIPRLPGQTPMGSLDPRTFALYQTRDQGRKHLVLVRPASSDPRELGPAVGRLRRLLAEFQKHHRTLQLRVTGEGLLQSDEAATGARDAFRAAALTLAGLAFLVVLCFSEVRRPLYVVFTVLLAAGWTLGLVAVTLGHLDVVTLWIHTLVMVLAADFGIHLLYRYEEERCAGLGSEGAMRVTLARVGRENLLGCGATAAAFAPLLLSRIQADHELAFLAGAGALAAFLATSTALPALLFLQESSQRPSRIRHHENAELIRLECWWLQSPQAVLAIFAGLALLPALAGPVRVSGSFLDLQDPDLESVATARSLGSRVTQYGVALAPDLASAPALAARFQALPTVDHVESLSYLFPADWTRRAELVRRIQRLVAPVRFPDLRPVRGGRELERALEELEALEDSLRGLEVELPQRGRARAREQVQDLLRTTERLHEALLTPGPGPVEDALDSFRRDLVRDADTSLGLLKAQRLGPPPRLGELPRSVLSRNVGSHGQVALRLFPREDVEAPGALRRFVADLESVDPKVTGTPVLLEHLARERVEATLEGAAMGLLLVSLLLLLDFRSLHRTGRALLPAGMGFLGMLAALGWLGQTWNPVNQVAIPLVLALGTVLGIHVVARFTEHRGEGLFPISTGPAVAISALATLGGFLALAGARHHGLAGLGLAMSSGLGTATAAGLLLLPALIKLLRGLRLRP